ncbi:MAG: hypothetical protein IJB89_01295 [Akkermansia sp.]|nr:hypothetical protein [Akkermansia sp.]
MQLMARVQVSVQGQVQLQQAVSASQPERVRVSVQGQGSLQPAVSASQPERVRVSVQGQGSLQPAASASQPERVRVSALEQVQLQQAASGQSGKLLFRQAEPEQESEAWESVETSRQALQVLQFPQERGGEEQGALLQGAVSGVAVDAESASEQVLVRELPQVDNA